MSYNRQWQILLALVLSCPVSLSAQMPPQPGKLIIRSEQPGIVFINQKNTNQRTTATFIVSPGNYQVSVRDQEGKPICNEKAIAVDAGQTTQVTCSKGDWTQP